MNLNTQIIDQRLVGIQDEIRVKAEEELNIKDAGKLKSLSFVYLCVKTMLDLDFDEAFDCLTEGGGDFGVDAMHITEEMDGEFGVTIFQGKYKTKLDGDSNFEQKGIESLINAIRHIFNPYAELGKVNNRLRAKAEQARSLVRDGFIPRVRAIACNNGLKWNDVSQSSIERANFGDQVTWEHVNHDVLVGILQRVKPVSETLRLTGKAIIEDMNFSRVCIGRIPVAEVASLMENHGEKLLERNIRRYLGLHGNRVNEGIRATLQSKDPSNFYFFNNGLTLVCDDFSYNALQNSDFQVKVDNLQIVNGGQTCMTIYKTSEFLKSCGKTLSNEATVLVRIYKLPKDNEDIVLQITHATNSQNPVDLKDLRSNDFKQQQLEQSIKALGYTYRRKRVDVASKPTDITTGAAAEAVLAVWRHAPHQAKFLIREHFGKLYNTIFSDAINGAQVIIASLLYRIAENRRRRPQEGDQQFVRYASCFIAMQMGRRLLKDMNITLDELDHRTFAQAKNKIDEYGDDYFISARDNIDAALKALYGEQEITMQQLSATFRRGDLIEKLQQVQV
ncbi:AIPR family protein [Aeromonas caviae]|uniref:AIPR family protein n=1 Tax=Aeromonas caviae TaxID=648 RepID=UPI002B4A6FF3|nr:AIPR family protein [Aeromonas caviae]